MNFQENLHIKEAKDDKIHEFFVSYDLQLMTKSKEIADLKSVRITFDLKKENAILKKRSIMSDEELEKKFIQKLESESNKYEIMIKQILLEKQLKIDQISKELFIAKEQLKDYRNNYINKLEHEFAMNRLIHELKELQYRCKDLETRNKNKIEIQENYLFVFKTI